MKAIRFTNKRQTKSFTIFTAIAIILSILIFSNLDVYINKQIAYFLITILSFFSILSAVKKAGKEFEEIIIDEENLKFYFQNKMKDSLLVSKSQISITMINDSIIDIKNKTSKKLIGRVNKNNLENITDWDVLLDFFATSNH